MTLSDAIQSFSLATLKPTATTEKTLASLLEAPPSKERTTETRWIKTDGKWREVPADNNNNDTATTKAMADVPPHEMHGQCYGFAAERNKWAAPTTTYTTEAAARPGYDSMSASEYLDDEPTLEAKVHHLAQMVRAAKWPNSIFIVCCRNMPAC